MFYIHVCLTPTDHIGARGCTKPYETMVDCCQLSRALKVPWKFYLFAYIKTYITVWSHTDDNNILQKNIYDRLNEFHTVPSYFYRGCNMRLSPHQYYSYWLMTFIKSRGLKISKKLIISLYLKYFLTMFFFEAS